MRIKAREVAEFIAASHALTFADLCSQRRTRSYARPRQVAMYCIRKLCPHMSYPAVGMMLGGRDHTTILHGFRKIEDLIATDYETAATVEAVLRHFREREPAPPSPLVAALQFHVMCDRYGKAMRAAA
jgi:chromosomal replication initiator protein